MHWLIVCIAHSKIADLRENNLFQGYAIGTKGINSIIIQNLKY